MVDVLKNRSLVFADHFGEAKAIRYILEDKHQMRIRISDGNMIDLVEWATESDGAVIHGFQVNHKESAAALVRAVVTVSSSNPRTLLLKPPSCINEITGQMWTELNKLNLKTVTKTHFTDGTAEEIEKALINLFERYPI